MVVELSPQVVQGEAVVDSKVSVLGWEMLNLPRQVLRGPPRPSPVSAFMAILGTGFRTMVIPMEGERGRLCSSRLGSCSRMARWTIRKLRVS